MPVLLILTLQQQAPCRVDFSTLLLPISERYFQHGG